MSKLSSADGQLQQHCEECKQSGTHKVIGQLSFCTNCIAGYSGWKGRYVYRGKFEETIEVAVKIIHKHKTTDEIINRLESETLLGLNVHPNIVRYHAREQDDDCWYVNVNNDEENNQKYVTKSLNTHQVHWNGIVCRDFV